MGAHSSVHHEHGPTGFGHSQLIGDQVKTNGPAEGYGNSSAEGCRAGDGVQPTGTTDPQHLAHPDRSGSVPCLTGIRCSTKTADQPPELISGQDS